MAFQIVKKSTTFLYSSQNSKALEKICKEKSFFNSFTQCKDKPIEFLYTNKKEKPVIK
jgi:hypothetical protein